MKEFINLFFILILLFGAGAAVHAQSTEWDALNKEAGFLYYQGQYNEAIEKARKALDVAEKTQGPDHPDVAISLSGLAVIYYKQGRYAQVEPLYQRALVINEKALGSDHLEVALVLNNLAELYHTQGQHMKAELLYQRALAIREKASGPDHSDVAVSLSNLATLYQTQGQYAQAESFFQRALAIREKTFGPNHPIAALSLNNLAAIYHTQGHHAHAKLLYQRALAIQGRVLGPDHPDVAQSLNNLAGLYQTQGQYAQAEPLYQRVLAILEKALGPDHPDVAQSLNNLARLYQTQGQYAQAEPLYQRILAILEKALGPDHLNVAKSLNDLATLYLTKGQYAQAESLHRRSLAILEKVLGPDHPDVATSLNNLANLYQTQGQYAQAEPLYQRALAIQEKSLGPSDLDVANSLSNLATLYQTQGQYAQAESFFQRALAILEKTLGPDHSKVAQSLNSLAGLYHAQGQYTQAESFFQRALAIKEKSLGSNHPDVALSLNDLATLYQTQGQYAQAESLYQRALAILDKALGPDHPNVASNLQNYAISLWMQGGPSNMKQALELLQRSNGIREHHLRLFLVRGSEQDKRDYMVTIEGDSSIMTTFHQEIGPANSLAAHLAFTTLLQRKGRLLDAMSGGVASLRQHMNPENKALLDQLADINEQRASLFMQAQQSKLATENYFNQKAQLEAQAQGLEKKISARSAEFLAQSQPIALERVQQAIPKEAALVEYLRYQPFNPKAKSEIEKRAPARYIAYVLRSQGDPLSVDLGDAVAIEQMVADFRGVLDDTHSGSVTEAARKLDAQIMQPVRKLLGKVRTVLISPDGALNLIPFGALKDEDNRYLVERFALTYLSSGRDLLRLDTQIASRQPVTLLANVDFGVVADKQESIQDNRGATNRRSNDYQMQFQSLPGTAAEAIAIGEILPTARILTGKKATESALKQLDRPQILHIATHGFFLSDLSETAVKGRGVSLMGTSQLDLPQAHNPLLTENPLLRSGLALANANRLQSGDDDGVLMAMETTGLDLWGTQLVVLSACETGVGEVRNGQGVFGLRRALVIAGSETQVMSLWKVDDLATKDLMVDYYQRLLASEGRSEALRLVQLAMLASNDRSHPYYWASFIVSGDWSGLDEKVLLTGQN